MLLPLLLSLSTGGLLTTIIPTTTCHQLTYPGLVLGNLGTIQRVSTLTSSCDDCGMTILGN